MPKSGTPIKLTIYNADDEPVKELSRLVVPWGILKRAVRMMDKMDVENPTEEDIDAISGLIVQIFGDKVTIEELDNGADMDDMISCLRQIIAKARGLVPNPPPPAK